MSKLAGWLGVGRASRVDQHFTQTLHSANEHAAAVSVEPINSPSFTLITEHLRTLERCTLLDLGPAFGSNVAFFGEMHCKLQIADCASTLIALSGRDDISPETYAAELEQILPLAGNSSYDAILTWDLLNYIDKSLFAALMVHLSPLVTGDTRLHGYFNTSREMPAHPQQYRLNLEGRVMQAVAPIVVAKIPCPCYSQQLLRTLMPDFNTPSATLLRNGMQEYLFRGKVKARRV